MPVFPNTVYLSNQVDGSSSGFIPVFIHRRVIVNIFSVLVFMRNNRIFLRAENSLISTLERATSFVARSRDNNSPVSNYLDVFDAVLVSASRPSFGAQFLSRY